MGNRQLGNMQWARAMGNGIFFEEDNNLKNKKMATKYFKDTTVYKKAFAVAMQIFEVSKSFPKEERYSLTDQVRRSSRSVCANMAEAYRKIKYPHTLFQKFLTVIWRILKPPYGLTLRLPAVIWLTRATDSIRTKY